jgi:hypothetical protein
VWWQNYNPNYSGDRGRKIANLRLAWTKEIIKNKKSWVVSQVVEHSSSKGEILVFNPQHRKNEKKKKRKIV